MNKRTRGAARPVLPAAMLLAVAANVTGAIVAPVMQQVQAQAASLQAPRPQAKVPGDRKFRFLLLGAATGGVLATGYYFLSERGARASSCDPWGCALPYLTLAGGLSGLFLSRELDAQRRAEAPRAGVALTFSLSEASLLAMPLSLAVRDSLVAVATDSGAQLVSAVAKPVALRRRGAGLSDMRHVAIRPAAPMLLIGTGSALWEGPIGAGQLSRALDGAVDALAVSDSGTMTGSDRRLVYRRGSGETATIDSLVMPGSISAITHDPTTGQWWVATDSALTEVQATGGRIALGRRLSLPARAATIAVSPDWIAVALGSEGVAAWARNAIGTSVSVPIRIRDEPRFAFDAAFLGNDLYVAGGVDGVFKIELSPMPQVVGSSRQLRYATSIRALNGVLWVGDRARSAVVRVVP